MLFRNVSAAAMAILASVGGNASAKEQYVRVSDAPEAVADLRLLGLPKLVEGRVIPPINPTRGLGALGPGPAPVVVFEQEFEFRYRFRVLEEELVSPDGTYRVPKGTVFHLNSVDENSARGRRTSWCVAPGKERACLIEGVSGWTWSQEQKVELGRTLRSFGRLLILQPDKLGPPPLRFPIQPPRFSEHTTERVISLAQVGVRLSPRVDPAQVSLEIRPRCFLHDRASAPFPHLGSPCYWQPFQALEESEDRVFVGGDNVGARLHYNREDRTFTVTRVAIDPVTGMAQ